MYLREAKAEYQRKTTTIDPVNRWVDLDNSLAAPTKVGNIEIAPEQQQLYVKDYTTLVGDAYIKFNPKTRHPDVLRHNINIMTGGGITLYSLSFRDGE